MSLPIRVEEEIASWVKGWDLRPRPESYEITDCLLMIWRDLGAENLSERMQEDCLWSLWVLGFELSRDRFMSRELERLTVSERMLPIIEEGGPLLFAYYTARDEARFLRCCKVFGRALRRGNLWPTLGKASASH